MPRMNRQNRLRMPKPRSCEGEKNGYMCFVVQSKKDDKGNIAFFMGVYMEKILEK